MGETCATCGAGPENRIPDPDDEHGSGAMCYACGGDYDVIVHLFARGLREEFDAARVWEELRGMVA